MASLLQSLDSVCASYMYLSLHSVVVVHVLQSASSLVAAEVGEVQQSRGKETFFRVKVCWCFVKDADNPGLQRRGIKFGASDETWSFGNFL